MSILNCLGQKRVNVKEKKIKAAIQKEFKKRDPEF